MTTLRQIVLDTETTGLSPKDNHRVIEIGCVELINRRLTRNNFHVYINPERDVDPGAEKVHGISRAFLEDKPLFSEVIEAFVRYIEGAELIIHNAPFDVGFLDHEFRLVGKPYKKTQQYCGVIDSLVLARRKHPGQRNSLDALCQRYKIDNSNRDLHGALLDAELLAQVYLLMSGGQAQLFQEETTPAAQAASRDIERIDNDRSSLPVIEANDDERQAHDAYLKKLKSKG